MGDNPEPFTSILKLDQSASQHIYVVNSLPISHGLFSINTVDSILFRINTL